MLRGKIRDAMISRLLKHSRNWSQKEMKSETEKTTYPDKERTSGRSRQRDKICKVLEMNETGMFRKVGEVQCDCGIKCPRQ